MPPVGAPLTPGAPVVAAAGPRAVVWLPDNGVLAIPLSCPCVDLGLPGVTTAETPTNVEGFAGRAVALGLIEGVIAPPRLLLGIGVTTGDTTLPLEEAGFGVLIGTGDMTLPLVAGFGVLIGTLLVNTVSPFDIVTGTEGIGTALLVTAPGTEGIGTTLLVTAPSTVEIAPPGLLIGTFVTNVVPESEIVIGKDKTCGTPLDTAAAAVDNAAAGLVIGRLAVNVVSGCETTTGSDMTA